MEVVLLKRARDIIDLEVKALQDFGDSLDSSIEEAVELITACKGKVIFLAIGKAGNISNKIASTLSSVGTPSIFVHASEAHHGDLGIISNDDLIIAVSNSGKTSEVILTLQLCKKAFNCKVIGITSKKDCAMAEYCDLIISYGAVKEACPFGLAPTTSTTLMTVIGDILAVLTMEKKNFTMEEYGIRHHGGYIGSLVKEKIKV